VSLSLREKQSLYHSLGQLLRSGVPLPGALKSLAQTSSGGQRRLIRRLNEAINAGKTMGEAVAAQRPEVSELEVGIISACEKSGRLEYGMTQLAGYHGAFATAREGILKKCAYPAFVLHFGILLFDAKTLLVDGQPGLYLQQVLGKLALIYGIVLIFFLLVPLLRDAGSKSAMLDWLLRFFPMIGKIRRAFATSRFCATYGMQLDAGINVIDALEAAQRASLSGLVRSAVRRAIPEVRSGGSQVGPLLAASGAFPEPMTRAVCVGEQTGELDQELTRMAAEYQSEALARLETAAEWVPRLLYMGIMLYVGYQIIVMYKGYIADVGKIIDGN
jgi:type IV pilus assembly protein PilC